MTNATPRPMLNTLRTIVRVVLGLFFVVSAIAKVQEFDQLELYIFSFGWLSLGVSFWVARLLVAVECIVGAALVFNIRRRATSWSALGLVVVFSAFLGYAMLVGRGDNCHCMGEFIEMSPEQSLLKNVVLFLALGFILPQRGGLILRGWACAAISIVVFGAICIISPPDNINPHLSYDKVLNTAHFDSLSTAQGRRIVCLYSTECPYCELASSKIASIARRHELTDNVEVWFARLGNNTDERINAFYERTLSPSFAHSTLPFKEFLTLTGGEMPVILLVDGDSVVREYNYRTIDEREIRNFFDK